MMRGGAIKLGTHLNLHLFSDFLSPHGQLSVDGSPHFYEKVAFHCSTDRSSFYLISVLLLKLYSFLSASPAFLLFWKQKHRNRLSNSLFVIVSGYHV